MGARSIANGWRLKFVAIIGIAIMLAAYAAPALAQGTPPIPHAFYGALTINGGPAPVGTTVEARGEGVRTGIEGNPITSEQAGRYGEPGALGKKLVVQGFIADGATLTFWVNGVQAPQTAAWHTGDTTELDLTATIPTPTPEPTATGTPQPTATPTPQPTTQPTATATPLPATVPYIPAATATPGPTATPVPTPTPTVDPATLVTPVAQAAGAAWAIIVPARQTTLRLDDNTTIVVPAGALSTTVQMMARTIATSEVPVAPMGQIRKAVEIQLFDINGAPLGPTALASAITISVPLSQADMQAIGGNPNNAELYRWDTGARAWIQLASQVDLVDRVIRSSVRHLSLFAVVVPVPVAGPQAGGSAPDRATVMLAVLGGVLAFAIGFRLLRTAKAPEDVR